MFLCHGLHIRACSLHCLLLPNSLRRSPDTRLRFNACCVQFFFFSVGNPLNAQLKATWCASATWHKRAPPAQRTTLYSANSFDPRHSTSPGRSIGPAQRGSSQGEANDVSRCNGRNGRTASASMAAPSAASGCWVGAPQQEQVQVPGLWRIPQRQVAAGQERSSDSRTVSAGTRSPATPHPPSRTLRPRPSPIPIHRFPSLPDSKCKHQVYDGSPAACCLWTRAPRRHNSKYRSAATPPAANWLLG